MINITDLHRLENEDMMAWQIRCCLAKRRKETDMDWIEIRDMLGLEITPDQLRKQAVGYEEYDNYIHGFNTVATSILSISDLHSIAMRLRSDCSATTAGTTSRPCSSRRWSRRSTSRCVVSDDRLQSH